MNCIIECLNLYLQTILEQIVSRSFSIMTFEDASNLLRDKAASIVPPGKGLSREQELLLVHKLNDNRPIFVIDWPKDTKPFYTRECSYDSSKVRVIYICQLITPVFIIFIHALQQRYVFSNCIDKK